MKIIDVVQGSPEWLQARLALPTASGFKRIITPVKAKAASDEAQEGYRARLLAEFFLGRSLEDEKAMQAMERGKELEPQAAAAYEFATGLETIPVGFVTRDDGKAGASPDRLVGSEGLWEGKAPLIDTHIGYMLNPHTLPAEYWCQLQGELYICERVWVDVNSYHPMLPPVTVRVERDEDFIDKLSLHLGTFLEALDAGKARLAPLRDARLAAMEEAMAIEGDGQDLLI